MSVESGSLTNTPQSETQSWDEIWVDAITKPFVQTYEGFANSPGSNPQTAYKWVFIAALIGFTIGMIIESIFLRDGPFVLLIGAGPMFAALSVIILAIWAGVSQSIASAFGGSGTYAKLVYTYASFAALILLTVGFLVAFPVVELLAYPVLIYQLVLGVIAVKAVNQIDWRQAAIATLALPAVFIISSIILVIISQLILDSIV